MDRPRENNWLGLYFKCRSSALGREAEVVDGIRILVGNSSRGAVEFRDVYREWFVVAFGAVL